jgi:hypothetical protein
MSTPNGLLILKQIKLTDKQHELLKEESQITGSSVSSIIRGLVVDHYRTRGKIE